MNNTKNFMNAFDNLQHIRRNRVKFLLMEQCEWKSKSTFHKKRKGEFRISTLEASVIEQIFAENGINAWTGEPLKQNYE